MDLEQLYLSYHRSLLSYLYGISKCLHTAEEIAQDTYLRLGTKVPRDSTIQHPRAYLFRTAHNLAMNQLARHTTEWKYRISEDIPVDHPSSTPPPDSIADSRQRLKLLLHVLDELPEPCRRAFVLHKFHNLTYAEIAQKFGVSQSLIEKHLMRALTHCRARLQASESDQPVAPRLSAGNHR